MDKGRKYFCTICGGFISDLATIPTCFDHFCLQCIERFANVTRQVLAQRRKASHQDQTPRATDLACPNCDQTFAEECLIKGVPKDSIGAHTEGRDKDIASLEGDIRETISSLRTCRERCALAKAQLVRLHMLKMKHLNNLKARVECLVVDMMNRIQGEKRSILSSISEARKDFQSVIDSEVNYYELLSDNADHLAKGLEDLLKRKDIVDDASVICDTSRQRSRKLDAASKGYLHSDALLEKIDLRVCTPGQTLCLEASPDAFRFEEEEGPPIADSGEIPLYKRKKWSYRLEDGPRGCSMPHGVCFWPDRKSFVVSECQNGTLLGFYVHKHRPDKPCHIITEHHDFRPAFLVRMDMGAVWGPEPDAGGHFPNLAMVDLLSQRIAIFDVDRKKLTYPMRRKFDLANGLAYLDRSDGRFLVTDRFQKTLEMLDPLGHTLWKVGGKDCPLFMDPHQVAIDYVVGAILVADASHLHSFDFDGRRIRQVLSSSSPPSSSSSSLSSSLQAGWELNDVCILRNSSILLAEAGEGCLLRLDPRNLRNVEEVLSGDEARGVRCMDVSSDLHVALTRGDGHVSVFRL